MSITIPKPGKPCINLNEIYFWTATIHNWERLLWDDRHKDIIIDSWRYLSDLGKIDVFAFVIMPNHLHSIWRMNEYNGKESAKRSFLKYTSHQFRKSLISQSEKLLEPFKVDSVSKSHEFWKPDSLPIPLYSRAVAEQKVNYIHNNPTTKHWNLAKQPCDYKYSSANFYRDGETDFKFLKNLWSVL